MLKRVDKDGDLLARPGRTGARCADRLTKYRSMRDASKTPNPCRSQSPKPPAITTSSSSRNTTPGGCTTTSGWNATACWCRWAVPKNLPDKPSVNHLAVHTEDHPLEYLTFTGAIPKGEYGAGKMIVWDTGTYETEKFRQRGGGRGRSDRHPARQPDLRSVCADPDRRQELARAPDEGAAAAPAQAIWRRCWPPRARCEKLKSTQWAFEGKWDGYRVLVDADHGGLSLRSRRGRDVTGEYPQFEALAADLADHHVILDGEAVALDESGVPSFSEMQNRARSTRVEYWAFDILRLDGRSLLRAKYSDRRRLLEALAEGGGLIVPDLLPGDGAEAMEYARKHRWEGVVAKKRDSTYQPGRRSASWIKDKNWNTQEVVIGGWRAGEGGRTSGIGALMLGIPEDGGLQFAGRVGTGFTEKELTKLKDMLKPLRDRRITVQHETYYTGRQGGDVRAARNWSARCATASARLTAGCVNRVGAGCARTRSRKRWGGSRTVVSPVRRNDSRRACR